MRKAGEMGQEGQETRVEGDWCCFREFKGGFMGSPTQKCAFWDRKRSHNLYDLARDLTSIYQLVVSHVIRLK